MNLRTVAFGLTIAAVVVLLGSLVMGLLAPRDDGLIPAATRIDDPTLPPAERIRVEVLNATAVSGLAARITDRLRAAGFDVVYYGNATGSLDRDSTTILDRAGNEAAISALARELDLARIEAAIDTALYLEATVILAEDWEE